MDKLSTHYVDAGQVMEGEIYVERNSHGSVSFTGRVDRIMPCTDYANVHLHTIGVRNSKGTKVLCTPKADNAELILR